MAETLLLTSFFVLGLFALGPFARRHELSRGLVVSAAFPLGLSIASVCGFFLLLLGIPLGPPSIFAPLLGIGCAGGVMLFRASRYAMTSITLPHAAGATLSFALLASAAPTVNFTFTTNDSFWTLSLARQLVEAQGLSPHAGRQLASWGILGVQIEAFGPLIGQEYLRALHPMLWLSLIGSFFFFSRDALVILGSSSRASLGMSMLATTSLSTTVFFLFQAFYIHNNFAASTFLWLASALFWLGTRLRRESLFVPAGLLLLAFSLTRTETPMAAAILLAALATTGIRRATLLQILLPITTVILLWYGRLYLLIGEGTHILNPERVILCIVPIAALTAAALLSPASLWKAAAPRTASIVLGLLAILLVTLFILKPEHMLSSCQNLFRNLTGGGGWGITWRSMALLSLLAFFRPKFLHQEIFSTTAAAYVLLILVMAGARVPYRVSWWDSANRMLVHLLPIVLFYVTARLGSADKSGAAAGPESGI
jgi:hypothetical protein